MNVVKQSAVASLTPSIRRGKALDAGPVAEYLGFRLADETFAVLLVDVREILSPPPLTYVPRAAHEVIGIISVRGLLVTVIDLRRKLGIEEAPATKLSRILLAVAPNGETLGLYVDEVEQVYRFAESEIENAASVLGGSIAEHVVGVGRRDEKIVVLLSLAPLLAAPR